MRFSVGSDDSGPGPEALVRALRDRGHDIVLHGPPAGEAAGWVDVAHAVAADVAAGVADQGVLFCWTGTGVSIAATKTPGIRAALCGDAQTARGARTWNDANVLCLSLRTTTPVLARRSSLRGSTPPPTVPKRSRLRASSGCRESSDNTD